jgi:type II secretory pathway pseudopilin PulG
MKKNINKNLIIGGGAFSVLEILVVVAVMSVLAGGAFHLFRGTIKMSEKGTQMMDYHQRAQKIIMRLTRDIKEASYIKPDSPAMITQDKIAALTVSPETQKIEIVKQTPDFFKTPTGPTKHVEYSEETVTYKVEPVAGASDYKLVRKQGDKDEEIIASNIDELLFYRLEGETQAAAGGPKVYGAGPKTVYINLKMIVPTASNNQAIKGYLIEFKTAVAVRGCQL